MSNAARQAQWRERHRNEALAAQRDRMSKLRREGRAAPRKIPQLRFIALDGEGAGVDQLGRQNYQLLRADDATGSLNKSISAPRLRTIDCLEFILSLPRDAILIGFFFGYDTTQILRDMPRDRIDDLFMPKLRWSDKQEIIDGAPDEYKTGVVRKNKYTYWMQYGIEYVPRQYFRVCRIDRETLKVQPGTSRTINETGGFFQKSFVEAINDWSIGDKSTRSMIAKNKALREQFTHIGATENEYCRQECILLAQLMEKFRETCVKANVLPRYWRGAGHLSARLHEINATPKRSKIKRWKIINNLAEDAYYGGRFEITRVGRINQKVWEYDINSAYPAAMLQLPCPIHSKWKKINGLPSERIYVADIHFRHSQDSFICGLPVREKGRLYFPRLASGVYWSPEIEVAKRMGAKIKIYGGYVCIEKCSCKPFDWVRELYEFRKSIGKSTLGHPIKLGINGLYGKFAQRVGGAPWRDYVMAGLITSFTRAKLLEACSQAPRDIIYIATDAVYSTRQLNLDIGDELGQWEEKTRKNMFIVQPGIYWSNNAEDKPKTRGIPRSVIIENRQLFETAWDHWIARGAANDPPIVPVFINQFIGLRAARARGKPEIAGTWLSDARQLDPDAGIRKIDFDWNNKRQPYGDYIQGHCMVTMPFVGRFTLRSERYDGKALTDFQTQLIEREDDPDFYPWGNSGE